MGCHESIPLNGPGAVLSSWIILIEKERVVRGFRAVEYAEN